MNRLDKFFTKNQNKLVGILAVIILSWFMGKLLDWIWSKPSGILKLLEFKVEVPIFAIILSVIVVWLFYRIYIKWAVSKRGLKIIKAEYGANNSFVDITAELNAKVNEDQLNVVIDNSIAGDPIPGTVKHAEVKYKFKDKVQTVKVPETLVLKIP